MSENLNTKFEQPKIGFDYSKAEELARKSLDSNLAEGVEKEIKKLYGSWVEPFEKCPANFKMFKLEVERQRLLMAQEKGQNPEVKTRPISYDKEQNVFIFKTKNNYEVKATPGDLIGDIDWELYYDFEVNKYPELAGFKKEYNDKIFQSQIAEIENEQLLIEKLEIDKVSQHDTRLGEAYSKTHQALLEKKARRQQGVNSIDRRSGFLFEKMLSSLLAKIAYDLGTKWDFAVQHATVEDDVQKKIDLFLRVIDRNRGIGVDKEQTPEETKKGFQVTLMRTSDFGYRIKQNKMNRLKESVARAKKYGQATFVDDVALISPGEEIEDVQGYFKKWERQGMVPGGPENFMSIKRVVYKYLQEIFQGTRLDLKKEKDNEIGFANDLLEYFRAKGMKEND
ncbi:MAG: hypothetical protein NT116_02960 [Candidatus Parcubacteria bacterium]|nr:hypothetical protein [Candidatus Parcubacteria bacterium]